MTRPSDVEEGIRAGCYARLNVAGNRGSVNPGICERVERFLAAVSRQFR